MTGVSLQPTAGRRLVVAPECPICGGLFVDLFLDIADLLGYYFLDEHNHCRLILRGEVAAWPTPSA